jgi:hypothetical protein
MRRQEWHRGNNASHRANHCIARGPDMKHLDELHLKGPLTNRSFARRLRGHLLLVFTAITLVSCGGGRESADVTRIEVTPGAQLIAGVGQTQTLEAKAFDAQGNVVAGVPIQWESSDTSVARVDASGVMTGIGLGATHVRARVGTVKADAQVLVAEPVAGAILVDDSRIVSIETPAEQAAFAVESRYRVVISGSQPIAVGATVIATQSKPVVGKVVEATAVGSNTALVLEVRPLNEVFSNLRFRQAIALKDVPVTIPTAVAERFDVTNPAPGQYRFTLKQGAKLKGTKTPSAKDFNVGPLQCSVTGAQPTVEIAKASFTVDLTSMVYDLEWTDARKAFLWQGTTEFGAEYEPTISVDAAAEFQCKLEFLRPVIPVAGAISMVAGVQLPLGSGIAAEAKFPITSAGASIALKQVFNVKFGPEWTQSFELHRQFEPEAGGPNLQVSATRFPVPESVKFEGSLQAFAYADLVVGPSGTFKEFLNLFQIESARFQDLELAGAKVGPKIEVFAATALTQHQDSDYASKYKASLDYTVGTGSGLTKFLKWAVLPESTVVEYQVSTDLATSPTGTVTADRESFRVGDTVNLKVALSGSTFDVSRGTVAALAFHNVELVRITRQEVQLDGSTRLVTITELPVSSGVTTLDFAWVATENGAATDFAVFVISKVAPGLPLEMVVASSDARIKVAVNAPTSASNLLPFNVVVDVSDSANRPVANARFSVATTGGSTSPSSGTTNAQGNFTVVVTPQRTATRLSMQFTITGESGTTAEASHVVAINQVASNQLVGELTFSASGTFASGAGGDDQTTEPFYRRANSASRANVVASAVASPLADGSWSVNFSSVSGSVEYSARSESVIDSFLTSAKTINGIACASLIQSRLIKLEVANSPPSSVSSSRTRLRPNAGQLNLVFDGFLASTQGTETTLRTRFLHRPFDSDPCLGQVEHLAPIQATLTKFVGFTFGQNLVSVAPVLNGPTEYRWTGRGSIPVIATAPGFASGGADYDFTLTLRRP